MPEVGWQDQDGDLGYMLLGRDEIEKYIIDYKLQRDVVALIEVTQRATDSAHAVFVSRPVAESIYAALGKELGR